MKSTFAALMTSAFLASLCWSTSEGFVLRDEEDSSRWRTNTYYIGPQDKKSEVQFSFHKHGLLGRVAFDVELMLPMDSTGRNISQIEVRFDPRSDMGRDGEVYLSRGGVGFDHATLHFESNSGHGSMHAFVTIIHNR